MSDLNNIRFSAAEILKGLVMAIPCVLTIVSAIWYFSTWSERVDMRLDDIDKDLRSIHMHYLQEKPLKSLETYPLDPAMEMKP